jgi:hypothetical protein
MEKNKSPEPVSLEQLENVTGGVPRYRVAQQKKSSRRTKGRSAN